jgi:hypothetical protein
MFFGSLKKSYNCAAIPTALPFHAIRDPRGRIAPLEHDASAAREQAFETF